VSNSPMKSDINNIVNGTSTIDTKKKLKTFI